MVHSGVPDAVGWEASVELEGTFLGEGLGSTVHEAPAPLSRTMMTRHDAARHMEAGSFAKAAGSV